MQEHADTKVFFIFGDQTHRYDDLLKKVLHEDGNGALEQFFSRTSAALRKVIGQLPSDQHSQYPRFSNLVELLAEKSRRQAFLAPGLELALLCTTQVASFVHYHTTGRRQYPNAAKDHVLGLCTGSLAAAAVCGSGSVAELIPAGVEAVLLAFRIGVKVSKAGQDIESCHSQDAWTIATGLAEDEVNAAIECFSAAHRLPPSHRPYISSVTAANNAISGPPSVLASLIEVEPFRSTQFARLPIHAPFHARHLYTDDDVDKLLSLCNDNILERVPGQSTLISARDGCVINASSTRDLLRSAIDDMLTAPLRWDRVLQKSATLFPHGAVIHPILAPSQSLTTALSAAGIQSEVRKGAAEHSSTTGAKSKLAIIGYSGRFPSAASADELWEKVLLQGLDVHREIPADRFDVDAHFDASGRKKNTSKIRHGCFIDEPGLFDPRFFNMSPREAANSDPGQRLALATAYEALEMGGIVPNRTPFSQANRVGVFYGMTSDDWREVNSGQNIDTYFIPGGNRAFTPGRINYHFKFSGPSYSVDTACSSSFAAIHTACNSLWTNDVDMAIAGGTNILTNPDNFAGLDRGHFLSTTGNCNTFDDGANGYCRADAVGTIVLKRLDDAIADNDPIKAVIVGAYTNHSAEADSITRPHVGAQAFIFNKVLAEAAIDPLDVSFVEMHGTGTQAGDAVEMASVLDVFASRPRGPAHPLYLGSVKSNVGHAESASGVTSLIKVLKMMEKNEIPPNCGVKTQINRKFPTDLDARNIHIPRERTSWKRPGNGLRRAFLNNFSAAGGNTAILLEDAPHLEPKEHVADDQQANFVVAASGKSRTSVRQNIARLVDFINSNPQLSLASLAYTTTARRLHHSFRLTATGSDLETVKIALQDQARDCESLKPIPTSARVPRVNFVFTGQGALYPGLARSLYRTNSTFRETIQRYNHICQVHGFPSFVGLTDGSIDDPESAGPLVSQLAQTCGQMALAHLWMSWGVEPSSVIGHSLGEYAALHVAGVLSASDAIYLVGTRARLLQTHCVVGSHCMLAAKASLEQVMTQLGDGDCQVACVNGPHDTVLSGPVSAIEALQGRLTAAGLRCTRLNLPYAFHSSQVDAIVSEYEQVARPISFGKPKIPYLSPLLGDIIDENSKDDIDACYLRRALRETVNWQKALLTGKNVNVITEQDIWLEIGPHPICSSMVKSVLGSDVVTLASLRRQCEDYEVLNGSISRLHSAGLDLNWNSIHNGPAEVLQLPPYQWDNQNLWIQYKNDFCLTKGDDPIPAPSEAAELASAHALRTAAVQRVVSEEMDNSGNFSKISIESDLHHPSLQHIIEGHKVNGLNLCSSSLWADVALTLTDYLVRSRGEGQNFSYNITNMNIKKPLVVSSSPALLGATATADWSARQIFVELYSIVDGKRATLHADCTAKLESATAWYKDWKRVAYLINGRMAALIKQAETDDSQCNRMKRKLAYKLFGSIVDYSECWQGMQEVTLDSAQLEATANVQFRTTPEQENHFISPCWIDSLGGIAGFIMNANDNDSFDLKKQAFINHGWSAMRCSCRFSRERMYQTYNRMQHVEGSLYSGDTYVFDRDEIVAVFEGIKFQGVSRQVLDSLSSSVRPQLSKGQASARSKQSAKPSHRQPAATRGKSTPTVSAEASPSKLTALVLEIIAEETGIKTSELRPSTNFADIGVDSLLSLNIAGRFRDSLGLEIDSSVFSEFPTVDGLTGHLSDSSGYMTPASSATGTPPQLDSEDDSDSAASEITVPDDSDLIDLIRKALASEVGITEQEIVDDVDLSELGVDSLLSLNILGTLRDATDMELPPTLFADNKSLADIAQALGVSSKPSITQKITDNKSEARSHPAASSVLLSGNPKTARKTLFLFPDGSGSAASYSPLPPLSSDIAVIGLNCPYLKEPQELAKCSLQDLTPSYVKEMLRRQPRGPFTVGGWSAGGICAMDAAQALVQAGESVDRLVLIDSPNPIGIEKLPARLYEYFNSIQLFGSSEPPSWLLPHFLAFIDALDRYTPRPFVPGTEPKTHIIWAEDGVSKNANQPFTIQADDPREMKWLLNDRTDFGGNGWERLVGEISTTRISGANHFNMMAGKNAQIVADFIKKAMT